MRVDRKERGMHPEGLSGGGPFALVLLLSHVGLWSPSLPLPFSLPLSEPHSSLPNFSP